MIRILIGLSLITYVSLAISGFCFREFRWFSGSEIVSKALEFELSIDGQHDDAVAFNLLRGSCCQIYRGAGFTSESDFAAIFFGKKIPVLVSYGERRSSLDKRGQNAVYIMDCCGRVLDIEGGRR